MAKPRTHKVKVKTSGMYVIDGNLYRWCEAGKTVDIYHGMVLISTNKEAFSEKETDS